MQKRLLFVLVAVMFAFSHVMPAFAGYFVDDMDDMKQDDIRTYYNLSPVVYSGSGIWSSLPDKSFASFSQTSQPVAKAIYKVNAAESVNVCVYTYSGTFVQKLRKNDKEAYVLGFDQLGKAYSSYPTAYVEQASFSPSALSALTKNGGKTMFAIFDDCFVFEDSGDSALAGDGVSDAIGYGVNVYTSQDGVKFQRQPLSAVGVDYRKDSYYCYEEYTARIPSTTKYVMVEINDFNRYYNAETKNYQTKVPRLMTSLAYVSIYGGSLIMGEEKTVAPPEPLPGSGNAYESVAEYTSSQESSRKSSAKASSAKSLADSEEETSKSRTSSKFEGSVIIGGSSAKNPVSEKTRASSKSSKAAAADSSFEWELSKSARESEAPMPTPSEGLIYKTRSAGSSDSFSKSVTGYIIVACVAIGAVVKFSWKK